MRTARATFGPEPMRGFANLMEAHSHTSQHDKDLVTTLSIVFTKTAMVTFGSERTVGV